MSRSQPPPITARLLQAALAFLGLSAVGGGLALLADPTGELIGLPTSILAGTPFSSYVVPGLLLLVLLGVPPLAVTYGLVVERRFAWVGSVVAGLVTIVWIVVQVALVGYVSRLQPFYLGVGLVVVTLALTSDVRAFYDAESELDALVGRSR